MENKEVFYRAQNCYSMFHADLKQLPRRIRKEADLQNIIRMSQHFSLSDSSVTSYNKTNASLFCISYEINICYPT